MTSDRTLSVINGGPVVEPTKLARLRLPFERGKTGSDGTGLGLAIAGAIAIGVRASLEISSPASNSPDGFEVGLQLPDIEIK